MKIRQNKIVPGRYELKARGDAYMVFVDNVRTGIGIGADVIMELRIWGDDLILEILDAMTEDMQVNAWCLSDWEEADFRSQIGDEMRRIAGI